MPPPTPRNAAFYILEIMIRKHNCRPGHTIRLNSLIMPFSKYPWQTSDANIGLSFAKDAEWIDDRSHNGGIKLTEKGYKEFEGAKMDLDQDCNEDITLEKVSGTRYEGVRALVADKMILVPDVNVPIEMNDAILRRLPNGFIQKLIVTDPGFYQEIHDIPAHYQVKYRQEGEKPAGSIGYHFYMPGDNARVNLNSIDNSTNTVSHNNESLAVIAGELTKLISAMGPKASTSEQYIAMGAIASAEKAAKDGDGGRVRAALANIGSGVKWVLDGAKEIGVSVAAEMIKGYVQN